MNILVIDIGGTGVKLLVTGATERRRFDSGPQLTPRQLVAGVKRAARGWEYDAISIGYPGPVAHDQPVGEPPNLGRGWVGFDFARAFGKPVRVINDAAMQALGSYRGGKMLFLGLGTGMGSTLIVDGTLVPMELGHLPYRRATFETHVGDAALKRYGRRKWRARLDDVVARLTAAFLPDDVVLGGGNVRLLKTLPPRCRAGDNDNAFAGGFRLWGGARLPRAKR